MTVSALPVVPSPRDPVIGFIGIPQGAVENLEHVWPDERRPPGQPVEPGHAPARCAGPVALLRLTLDAGASAHAAAGPTATGHPMPQVLKNDKPVASDGNSSWEDSKPLLHGPRSTPVATRWNARQPRQPELSYRNNIALHQRGVGWAADMRNRQDTSFLRDNLRSGRAHFRWLKVRTLR